MDPIGAPLAAWENVVWMTDFSCGPWYRPRTPGGHIRSPERVVALASDRVRLVSLLRRAGPSTVLRRALEHAWGRKIFLGLRCDLSSLSPIHPAKFNIAMRPAESTTFSGFLEEIKRVEGEDCVEVFLRQLMCEAGVQTLYTAAGPDGSLACALWLVTAQTQHLLHAHTPGRYPKLAPDEVILDGAYTFGRFRRNGVMSDGMAQLLKIARDNGARTAFGFVAANNIPSLRACANVGLVLDHVRTNIRRFGHRSSVVQPVDEEARRFYSAAMAAGSSARGQNLMLSGARFRQSRASQS